MFKARSFDPEKRNSEQNTENEYLFGRDFSNAARLGSAPVTGSPFRDTIKEESGSSSSIGWEDRSECLIVLRRPYEEAMSPDILYLWKTDDSNLAFEYTFLVKKKQSLEMLAGTITKKACLLREEVAQLFLEPDKLKKITGKTLAWIAQVTGFEKRQFAPHSKPEFSNLNRLFRTKPLGQPQSFSLDKSPERDTMPNSLDWMEIALGS